MGEISEERAKFLKYVSLGLTVLGDMARWGDFLGHGTAIHAG
jgi:hypothetical protein